MTKMTRSHAIVAALALLLSISSVVGFAQSSGQTTYKTRCQACHGITGMGDTNMGKAIKVKPVTDPEVMKYTQPVMLEIVRNGKGNMPSFKSKLTDEQIKDAVEYFRTLIK